MKRRAMVCMSGGVDSSTTAAILLKNGYDVTGVTFELTDSLSDDAEKVCKFLGIKHIILDYKNIFYEKVIKNFAFEYLNGRTPNPCVTCNENIKFGEALNFALKSNFDMLATGHYAEIIFDEKSKRFLLKKAKSKKKDQSYFLYRLNQKALSKIVFPLSKFEKSEVRQLARDFGLPVSEKPESQDICFLKGKDCSSYIEEITKKKPNVGNFIDENGNILGLHSGITKYTIGQRRGIGMGFGKRMYVNHINTATNEVILSNENSLYRSSLTAKNLNFIKIDKLNSKMSVFAKIRYNAPYVEATISPNDEGILVEFKTPQKSIAPGQSVVFYDSDGFVIGGGIISS